MPSNQDRDDTEVQGQRPGEVALDIRSLDHLDNLNNNTADVRRHLATLQQREWELLMRAHLHANDIQERANIEANLANVRREREEYRVLLETTRANLDAAMTEYMVDDQHGRKYGHPGSQLSLDGPNNPVIDQHDSGAAHPSRLKLWINPFTIFLIIWQAAMIALLWTLGKYSAFDAPENSVPTYYKFFVDVSFMLLFGFGYLMVFLRKFGFSAVGLTFLLTVLCVEWALLTLGLAKHVGGHQSGLPINLANLIDADFAAAAVLISFGAVIGKTTPAQLIFMGFCEVILYSVNYYVAFFHLNAVDVGGSMTIHAFGAFFGLAASMFLSPAKAKEHPDKTSIYHSDILAMIGTLFLWLFWPSFNAALAPPSNQVIAIMNTFLSLVGSTVATFCFSYILRGHGKFDMVDIQNATLAGGVAMGSSANLFISPGGALTLGFCAGSLATVGFVFFSPLLERKLGLQDTCGIFNLHGMSGVLGGIASAVAVSTATSSAYGADIATYFPHGVHQGPYQIYVLLVSVGIGLVGGAVVGFLTKTLFPGPDIFFQDHKYWGVPVDYLRTDDGADVPANAEHN